MTYPLAVNRDKPVGLWMMDDFTDHSGYNRTAQIRAGSSAQSFASAITASAGRSSVFNKDSIAELVAPVFVTGKENRDFSLEAWVYPIAKTAGITEEYKNYFYDPLFDYGTAGYSQAGWNIVQDTTFSHRGGTSLKAEALTDDAAVFNASFLLGPIGLYTISGWIYIQPSANNINATFRTGGAGIPDAERQGPANQTQGEWTWVEHTFSTIEADTYTALYLYVQNTKTGDVVWYDGITITGGAEAKEVFSGDSPGAEWLGVPGESHSIMRTSAANQAVVSHEADYNTLATNYIGNSRFTTVTGWSQYGASLSPVLGGGAIATATGTMTNRFGTHRRSVDDGLENYIAMGETKYVSFDVSTTVPEVTSARLYVWADAGGNQMTGSPLDIPIIPDGTIQRVEYEVTPDLGNCDRLYFSVFGGVTVGATGQEAFFDRILVTDEPTTEYFDGDSDSARWEDSPESGPSSLLGEPIYDGIGLNNNTITFKTRHENDAESSLEYLLPERRAVHVVGVHTFEQNRLYVDGQLVSSIDTDEDVQSNSFRATGPLLIGDTTSSQHVAVNGVAVYDHALSSEAIQNHYAAGRKFVPAESVVAAYGGIRLPLSQEEAAVYLEQTWDTQEDWDDAVRTNISVLGSSLVPTPDDAGISLAGEWLDSYILDFSGDTSIYGVAISWVGEGMIIEASVDDGTTWEVARNHELLEIIPAGFDPTDKDLELRVTFPGGIQDDGSFLQSLTVTGFADETADQSLERPVVVSRPAITHKDLEPMQYSDLNGALLNGGMLTIQPELADEPMPINTVEFWVKRTGDISFNFAGTTYNNGALGVRDTPIGEWALMHVVLDAPAAENLNIWGDVIVGQVAIYPTLLTADEVAAIYTSYTGVKNTRINDQTVIGVTETAQKSDIYAHDWSITGGGA